VAARFRDASFVCGVQCAAEAGVGVLALQVIGIQPQTPVAWSHDGTRLCLVSSNFDIFVMKVAESGARQLAMFRLLAGHKGNVKSLCFHPRCDL
jgi:hypothetical protein